MDEGCGVGNIGPLKDLDGVKEGCAVCEEYASVPHFEGKDDWCETTDIPGAEYLDIPPLPVNERLEELPPSVANLLVGCAKPFEYLETRYNASTTHILVVCRFEPLRNMDGPRIDADYEECLLVLRFEGEEAETMDLPAAEGFPVVASHFCQSKSYRKLSGSCFEHICKERTCPGWSRATRDSWIRFRGMLGWEQSELIAIVVWCDLLLSAGLVSRITNVEAHRGFSCPLTSKPCFRAAGAFKQLLCHS